MLAQPDGLALDDEDQAFVGRSLARPLVLGQTLPALLRAVGGVEPGEGRAGEPKRLLQTFTGPAEGGGLLGRDFGLGAPQALAGSAAHSNSLSATSRARAPITRRRSTSTRRPITASARPPGSPLVRTPVSPSRTTSLQPGAATATAGRPQAAASASTRPCVSVSEAKTKRSAAW